MKTTAVCAIADESAIHVGFVGDSRFYGFKKDGTYLRTLDHSIPQLLVRSGSIKESEIRNHPNRNMLLKVMGDPWEEPMYELLEPLPLGEYSALLLCSDGFWELITESEMLQSLNASATPQEWLDHMTATVEARGDKAKMDNYTAIAVYL